METDITYYRGFKGTYMNKQFVAPKTLGELRELAFIVLKEIGEIPDRATLFTNAAGMMNINWVSDEELAKQIADAQALKESQRRQEIVELEARLVKLKDMEI